jgi:hypothetical protein
VVAASSETASMVLIVLQHQGIQVSGKEHFRECPGEHAGSPANREHGSI